MLALAHAVRTHSNQLQEAAAVLGHGGWAALLRPPLTTQRQPGHEQLDACLLLRASERSAYFLEMHAYAGRESTDEKCV